MTAYPWAGGLRGVPLAVPPERLPRRQPRRITQLCGSTEGVFALCDDGTVWHLLGGIWCPEPAIPQPEA